VGSASQGIYMVGAGGIDAASSDLVITGAQHYPIHAAASVAGSIPTGTYTGNAIDEIDLEGAGMSAVAQDTTLHDRGVPYHVGDPQHPGQLVIAASQPSSVAKLVIEPNVTLRFEPGGGMFVQVAQNTLPATGALVAAGTATAPIVFTSAAATPAAGDWQGIHFNGIPDPADDLDYVRVEYAGGDSSLVGASCLYPGSPPPKNVAAIRVFGEPTTAFVHNTTITSSAGHGFDRGWTGDATISFLGDGNTETVARCKESYPKPSGAACPTPVPCP
jgi:hypothetical protein